MGSEPRIEEVEGQHVLRLEDGTEIWAKMDLLPAGLKYIVGLDIYSEKLLQDEAKVNSFKERFTQGVVERRWVKPIITVQADRINIGIVGLSQEEAFEAMRLAAQVLEL